MGAALELPEYPIIEHMTFHFQSKDKFVLPEKF
jgi:hypothetical protein